MSKQADLAELQATLSSVKNALLDYEILKQQCVDALGFDPTSGRQEHNNNDHIAIERKASDSPDMTAPPMHIHDTAEEHPVSKVQKQLGCATAAETAHTDTSSEDALDFMPLSKRQRLLRESAPIENTVKPTKVTCRGQPTDAPQATQQRQIPSERPVDEHATDDVENFIIIDGSDSDNDASLPEQQQQSQQRGNHLPPMAAATTSKQNPMHPRSEQFGNSLQQQQNQQGDGVIDICSSDSDEEPVIIEERPPPPPQLITRTQQQQHQPGGQRRSVRYQYLSTENASSIVASTTHNTGIKLRPPSNVSQKYGFTNPALAREFRQSFTMPSQSRQPSIPSSSTNFYSTEKQIKEKTHAILKNMHAQNHDKASKQKAAWHQAAMSWRQKNMPTQPELKKRKAEAQAQAAQSVGRRTFPTPKSRAAGHTAQGKTTNGSNANASSGGGGPSGAAPPKPAADASEADMRSYYRQINQSKVSRAASFVQVLRAFNVPCEAAQKVKDAWRTAVRMYHPDSNSKERVWKSEEQKLECEEIMKLINERRPDDL